MGWSKRSLSNRGFGVVSRKGVEIRSGKIMLHASVHTRYSMLLEIVFTLVSLSKYSMVYTRRNWLTWCVVCDILATSNATIMLFTFLISPTLWNLCCCVVFCVSDELSMFLLCSNCCCSEFTSSRLQTWTHIRWW